MEGKHYRKPPPAKMQTASDCGVLNPQLIHLQCNCYTYGLGDITEEMLGRLYDPEDQAWTIWPPEQVLKFNRDRHAYMEGG